MIIDKGTVDRAGSLNPTGEGGNQKLGAKKSVIRMSKVGTGRYLNITVSRISRDTLEDGYLLRFCVLSSGLPFIKSSNRI